MASNKQAVSISLDAEQIRRLDAVTQRTRISRSVLVREAVDVVLARYEPQMSLDLPEKPPVLRDE
jgi:metal-responsive CopG/Arc/MetJ family transcriptional regulator